MARAKVKEGRKPKRRKRTIITRDQLDMLESLYRKQHWPNKAQKDQLAQELRMTPHFVSIWFQNKRARVKREEEKTAVVAPELSPKSKESKVQSDVPPQERPTKMKLSFEMKSPPDGIPRRGKPMLLPRPKSPLSRKFKRSVLSRSAYGLPFSCFTEDHVKDRNVEDYGSHNVGRKSNGAEQAEADSTDMADTVVSLPAAFVQHCSTNVKRKQEPGMCPALLPFHDDQTTENLPAVKNEIPSPLTFQPADVSGKDSSQPRGVARSGSIQAEASSRFNGGRLCRFLEDAKTRNLVSEGKPHVGKYKALEGLVKRASARSGCSSPEGLPVNECQNTADTFDVDDHAGAQPPTLFKCIVAMAALAEGGIIQPSHPDFPSATNDALYGILINKHHRLIYNVTYGPVLVQLQGYAKDK